MREEHMNRWKTKGKIIIGVKELTEKGGEDIKMSLWKENKRKEPDKLGTKGINSFHTKTMLSIKS